MAANLLKADHVVTVYNRMPAKTEKLIAQGAKAAGSIADVGVLHLVKDVRKMGRGHADSTLRISVPYKRACRCVSVPPRTARVQMRHIIVFSIAGVVLAAVAASVVTSIDSPKPPIISQFDPFTLEENAKNLPTQEWINRNMWPNNVD
jgi:hypothetical protein